MIRIFDGVLVVRTRLETDTTGFCIRNLWIEASNPPAGEFHIWVFDGKGNNARRREIYPEYKMNREPAAEDVMAYINLWRSLVKLTPAFSVAIDGWEADDVIAHLAARYAGMGQPVEVVTRDADLRQLETIPGVTVLCQSLAKVPSDQVRLYKAVVGDPSDNIKGIPGFGAKTWETCDKAALLAWFEASDDDVMPPEDLPLKVRNTMVAVPERYRAIWRIVGPLEIEADVVNAAIFPGTDDKPAAEAILAQFLQ